MSNPKPLRVLVLDGDVYASPEVQAWMAKGHSVEWPGSGDFVTGYDLVLGRAAWHMTPAHLPYLDLAEKAARKRKYPPPVAKKGVVGT